MENIVIIVHLIVALAIIGMILMQQGKGAEAGASFGGGASQTVFGSQGGGSFFAKATGVLAFVFFATSFSLAIIAKNKTDITVIDGIPSAVEQVIPESELPTVGGQSLEGQSSTPSSIESELPTVESVESAIETATEELKDSVKEALPADIQDTAK